MLGKTLCVEDICTLCHVPVATVLRWIQQQNLKTVRLAAEQPLVWRSDLISFLESVHEPVPQELVLVDTLRMVIAVHDAHIKKWIYEALHDLFPHASLVEADNAFETGFQLATINPHLFIIDVDIPSFDSVSVFTKLKNTLIFKFTKIIAIGSAKDESAIQALLASGADSFLSKPFLLKPFTDAVIHHINELL